MARRSLLLLGLSFAIVLLIASEAAAKDLAEAPTASTTISVDKSMGAVEGKTAVKDAKYEEGYRGRYPGGGYRGNPGSEYVEYPGGEYGRYPGDEYGRYPGGGYEGERGGYEGERDGYEGERGGYEGERDGYEGGRECYYGYCGNHCCNAAEVEVEPQN